MANLCEMDLHVVSKKEEAIIAVKDAFTFNEDEGICAGRIYDSYVYEEGFNKETGEYYAYIMADVAWSVRSAILDKGILQKLIEKYNLDLEIYSEEPGCGFMEHFRWEGGEQIENEVADFALIHLDDMEDEDLRDEFFNMTIVKKYPITIDNYESFADEEGYIKLGGFDYDWVIN